MSIFRSSTFIHRTTQFCCALLVSAFWCGALFAQQGQSRSNGKTVDARNFGERLVAVVPMIGTGKPKDPFRPFGVLAPPEPERPTPDKKYLTPELPQILSFRYELSDDKKTALLEIVGRDEEALTELRNAKRADVKIFELGKATKEEIQAEFRKYKPGFDADKFGDDKAPEPKPVVVGGGK